MARNRKARKGWTEHQTRQAIRRQEKEATRLLKEQETRAAEAGKLKRAQKRAPGEELL